MKTRSRRRERAPAPARPAFWDTSGIVPLCCYQPQTSSARHAARLHPRQIVWWATPLEMVGSLHRLKRQGTLNEEEHGRATTRAALLRERWSEIQPTDEVRERAERLLAVHQLRTADALQLAAALTWCGDRPKGRHFICADNALLGAAGTQGFVVVRVAS